MPKATILDGYVDEPTALGVPPYISPYPRYCAGALIKHGYEVRYITIDQLRGDPALWELLDDAEILVIIAGLTVPGVYLGGTPITLSEIAEIDRRARANLKILAGPIRYGYSLHGGRRAVAPSLKDTILVSGDVEKFLLDLLGGRDADPRKRRSYRELDEIAPLGAEVISQHPRFPYVMIELETGRGCERPTNCSFCTEPLYGKARWRAPFSVAKEVRALHTVGARYFRLGRQSNILAYRSIPAEGRFPKPNPESLRELYTLIRDAAPNLKVLHTDNVNPGFVAVYPKESEKMLSTIAEFNTPGDVWAMGVESADPNVIRENNLKASPKESFEAIRIANEAGGFRVGGIPKALPGINFLFGLPGESEKTYRLNLEFLRKVMEAGYMLRRINIRQVMAFPGTPLWERTRGNPKPYSRRLFFEFRERVQKDINLPMLRKVFPKGTVLREVVIEKVEGRFSLGRQVASYPILVRIPGKRRLGEVLDVFVVNWAPKSVVALPFPLGLNGATLEELSAIEGVGEGRARRIVLSRPFSSVDDALNALDDARPLEEIRECLRV